MSNYLLDVATKRTDDQTLQHAKAKRAVKPLLLDDLDRKRKNSPQEILIKASPLLRNGAENLIILCNLICVQALWLIKVAGVANAPDEA